MERNSLFSAKDIISHTVIDATGNDIGLVKDFFIDPFYNKVKYIIISHGGAFGTELGSNYKAVPIEAVEINPNTSQVMFHLGNDLIYGSPDIDYDNFETKQKDIIFKVDKYYGKDGFNDNPQELGSDAGNDPYYTGKRHVGSEGNDSLDLRNSKNNELDNSNENKKKI
jgi:sporulation protein YlmC with PRC-barrel domain